MVAREVVDAYLRQIGATLGLALVLDDDGRCALACEDDLECTVSVPNGSDVVVLEAPLARVTAADRAAFFEELLALNLHGAETDGCWLALDRTRDAVVLCLTQPVEGVDATTFANVLGGFISTGQRLADRVAGVAGTATTAFEQPPALADERATPPVSADMMRNLQFRV